MATVAASALLLTASAGLLQQGPVDRRAVMNDSVAQEKATAPVNESSIIDEVIWVVGDEPILKSEVENMRM